MSDAPKADLFALYCTNEHKPVIIVSCEAVITDIWSQVYPVSGDVRKPIFGAAVYSYLLTYFMNPDGLYNACCRYKSFICIR